MSGGSTPSQTQQTQSQTQNQQSNSSTAPASYIQPYLQQGIQALVGDFNANGPAAWAATTSTFKGQPVLHATHFERDTHRLVSVTFTGGALTAFAIWPPGTAFDSGDTLLAGECGTAAACRSLSSHGDYGRRGGSN